MLSLCSTFINLIRQQYRLLRGGFILDGDVHQDQQEYDQIRTEQLESYGYRVIRFKNEEIMNELPAVLERIREAAKP